VQQWRKEMADYRYTSQRPPVDALERLKRMLNLDGTLSRTHHCWAGAIFGSVFGYMCSQIIRFLCSRWIGRPIVAAVHVHFMLLFLSDFRFPRVFSSDYIPIFVSSSTPQFLSIQLRGRPVSTRLPHCLPSMRSYSACGPSRSGRRRAP
jgi:hypothetical protein